MVRKTKKAIEEENRPKIIEETKIYIKKNGKQITKNFIVWNTYPICVKEVCVLSAAVLNDQIIYGDYNESKKEFDKVFHTDSDLDYSYMLNALSDMKAADTKKTKK